MKGKKNSKQRLTSVRGNNVRLEIALNPNWAVHINLGGNLRLTLVFAVFLVTQFKVNPSVNRSSLIEVTDLRDSGKLVVPLTLLFRWLYNGSSSATVS
ncbi:hypothetical protein CDAR_441771 [Caerostris darwini]|uniref:LAGLIDADG homing endonuclease n=1 Tax=Caerostris darwini TaxID=1538125 RepID=A0AAV4W000_9ARAC|nr:hypothetical protein CDAR_441771 [Caerostris darwini]